jgi:hypothetical protein
LKLVGRLLLVLPFLQVIELGDRRVRRLVYRLHLVNLRLVYLRGHAVVGVIIVVGVAIVVPV